MQVILSGGVYLSHLEWRCVSQSSRVEVCMQVILSGGVYAGHLECMCMQVIIKSEGVHAGPHGVL